MSQSPHSARVQCLDCHNILVGSPADALIWSTCPACSSHNLVFAQSLSADRGYPAFPGQPLARWQQAQSGAMVQVPPAYVPGASVPAPPAYVPGASVPAPPVYVPGASVSAPPAYVPDARAQASPPHAPTLPQPNLPGRRPGPGPRPLPPRGVKSGPGKGRPLPPGTKKPASKTLIVVRLLVALGAVIVSAVVAIIAINSRGGGENTTASEPSNEEVRGIPTPTPRTGIAPRTAEQDTTGDRKQAIDTFLAALPGWRGRIEDAAKKVSTVEGDLKSELGSKEREARTSSGVAAEAVVAAELALETLETQRAASRDAEAAAQTDYQARLGEQTPTSRFFQALETLRATWADTAVAEAAWEVSRKDGEAASAAYDLACEAYYAIEDTADEEAAMKAVMDADAALVQAQRTEAGKRIAVEACRKAEVSARFDVSRAYEELALLSDSNAKRVVAAYAVYEASLKDLDAQWAKLAQLDSSQNHADQEIDRCAADAAKVGENYRRVHARLKELDREMRSLAERFKNDGKTSTKQAAQRAIDTRNDYYDNEYKPVKDDMSASEKELATAKSSLKKIQREILKEKAKLQELLKADAGEQRKLDKVLDAVRKTEEPAERERLRALDAAQKKLRSARDKLKQFDAEISNAKDVRDAKSASADSLRLEADQYKAAALAAASGMATALLDLADKMKALEGKETLTAGHVNSLVEASGSVVYAASMYDPNGWLPYMASSSNAVRLRLDARNMASTIALEETNVVSWSGEELLRLLLR